MIKFAKFDGFEYTKKANYAELTAYLLDTDCQTHELGLASNGEMIYGLSIGDLTKPMILIDGGMHGAHEWRCTHWVKEFMERIAIPLSDENKPLIQKMKAEFCFFAIPCLNPHGYTANKYYNFNLVNLNRNFPIGWDGYVVPDSANEKGDYPLSEPESVILKNAIDTYRVIGYINTHTWGGNSGSVFETSSTVIEHRTILNDLKLSIEKSVIGYPFTFRTRSTATTPWAIEWVGSQTSKAGRNVLCVTFETGELETDYIKAEIGMTGLFAFSYYVSEWFKTRRVVL